MKQVILLLLFAGLMWGQGMVGPSTLPDVTGDGATHRFTTVVTSARTMCFTAPATNTAAVRVGDANTSATRGQYIAPGGAYCGPVLSVDPRTAIGQHVYDLSKWYYYAGVGDRITILYAN